MTSPSQPLDDRQRTVLDFIRAYIGQYHIAPTTRQIGESCGISSKAVVQAQIKALVAAGYLGRYEGLARGIYLKDKE